MFVGQCRHGSRGDMSRGALLLRSVATKSTLLVRRVFWRTVNTESDRRLAAWVGEFVLGLGRNDDYIARLHFGALAGNQGVEVTFHQKQNLLTAFVGFRFFARRLTGAERHHRRLTMLGRLQNFEPGFRSIDVGAANFHRCDFKTATSGSFGAWLRSRPFPKSCPSVRRHPRRDRRNPPADGPLGFRFSRKFAGQIIPKEKWLL